MVTLRVKARKTLESLGISYTESRIYGPASRGDFAHSTKVLVVSDEDYKRLQQHDAVVFPPR